MSWLQYSMEILKKVSFDKGLVRKELRKALKSLSREEAHSLNLWYKEKFENYLHLSSGKQNTGNL